MAQRWLLLLIAALIFATYLVPNRYPPWWAFYSELPAAVASALVVAYALTVIQRFSVTALGMGLAAMAAVPWIQWLGGSVSYFGDALLASLYLLAAAILVSTGATLVAAREDRLMPVLATAMLFAAVASTGIALYQWFGLSGLHIWVLLADPGQRTGANLSQPNHLATLLLIGMASAVYLRSCQHIGEAVLYPTVAFFLLGLALTQSRTPWLVGIAIGLWMALRGHAPFGAIRFRATRLVALALWYAVLFWAVWAMPPHLLLLDAGALDLSRLTAGTRPDLWAQWLQALTLSPWLGYGWLQGHTAQSAGALTVVGFEYAPYAHNLFLDLLAWNGLPVGGLICLGLFAWYLRMARRVEGPEQWLRFAVVTSVAVHSMLEYPFAYTYFILPAMVLAGQMEAQVRTPVGVIVRTHRPAWILPRWAVILITGATSLGALAVVRDYFIIQTDSRELRAQQANIGHRTSQLPDNIWVLDQMLASSRVARIEPWVGMPVADLDDLLRVSRRFPTRFFLHQAVVALAVNGRTSEASVEMLRLYGLYGPEHYVASVKELAADARERHPSLRPFVESLR